MNSSLIDEEHQIFEHNIKKEPEVEFLCILPSYDSGNAQEGDFVQVKKENEIQSEEIQKLQCKICQKVFGSSYNLRQHEKSHQNQKCKVCNRKIPAQRLEQHMRTHQNEKTERKFECKICSQKFVTKFQLNYHVLRHSKGFQCDLCGHYTASTKHDLMRHLTSHLAPGQFKCFFCRQLFEDRESFRFHSRQVHGDPRNRNGLTKADLSCKICGKECDDVKARKSHEKSHGEKVQCPICNFKCQPSSLAPHLKLHELKKKGKNFICDVCGHKSNHKRNLKTHLELHLSPDRECNVCWKQFTNTNSLKIHSRTIHNLNVEPSDLCCNICHLKCKNLAALRSHQLTHEGPKACPVCSKSIKATSFSYHMKLHKLKKEKKKFECKYCEKNFYTKSELTRHMKTHSKRLECDLCEYRTGRKELMKNHMAKHIKLEPIKCGNCSKTFKTAKGLKLHISRTQEISQNC